MEVETIAELSRVSNIVGIKDASGDVAFGQRAIEACGGDFFVTSGDDVTAFELALRGGKGVISVASHVLPSQFSSLCARALRGDKAVVADYAPWLDLVRFLYCEANPIPVKTALCQMGVIDTPEMRLPLVPLAEPLAVELRRKLQAKGLAR
jgi:4-hydroxy-tetrahydrodipicolinate synthase